MKHLLISLYLGFVLFASCQNRNSKDSSQGGKFNEILPQINMIQTRLHTSSNFVIGQTSHGPVFVVQGDYFENQKKSASIEAYNPQGKPLWNNQKQSDQHDFGAGAYVHWVDKSGLNHPVVTYSYVPKPKEMKGGVVFVNANDGSTIHELSNNAHFGNNNSLLFDFNKDGLTDYLYADLATISAIQLSNFQKEWTFQDGVRFCWSLPALFELKHDQNPIIYFGSEYDSNDGLSSFLAIDLKGNRIWKSSGHVEDLGSTPVFIADIDGDGTKEILKVGLDLEHHNKQKWNHMYVFNTDGELISKCELGFTGIAIGDVDGDGRLEGVGISNTRDGGLNGLKEIRCIELSTGKLEWSVPVERAYLDCNSPVMADINDDGYLEAIVGTGNPAGYGRLPNSEPWGDIYVVSHQGEILKRQELMGRPVNMGICDYNQDGISEFIVVVDGKPGWINIYSTKAKAKQIDWPVPFGNAERSGTHSY